VLPLRLFLPPWLGACQAAIDISCLMHVWTWYLPKEKSFH
jgi:hypothetical protein